MSTRHFLPLLACLLIWAPCGPDEFTKDPFYCEGEAGRDSCGNDAEGRPMVCYQGEQLGGRNFCVPNCEAGAAADEICLDTNNQKARLKRCKPSNDALVAEFPRGACGHPDLACLRTDLLRDEGVCVAGKVCETDNDCGSTVRSVCASTIVKALYKGESGVKSDHLFCVQAGCQARNASCPQGETCLPKLVPAQSGPPDVCVPHCDASLSCPINHFCYRAVSPTDASPNVCLAGLSSYRCQSQNECLIGDCLEVLPGAKVCTLPCEKDTDCVPLETRRSWQVCGRAGGATSGPGACLSVDLFGGQNCLKDSECPSGQICSRFSPYSTSVEDIGYCLTPCGPDGACPRPAGVPHTCYNDERPVCYPGKFGLRCSGPDVCIGEAKCQMAMEMGENDSLESHPICTIPCTDDQACNSVRHGGNMYCEQGSCVLGRRGGRLCARDGECSTGACRPSIRPEEEGKGIRRCTYPPGAAP